MTRDENAIILDAAQPCAHCGRPTTRLDILSEAAVHLGCQPLLDAAYCWAVGLRPVSWRGLLNMHPAGQWEPW